MPDEKTSDELKDIIDRESNSIPRKVSRVGKVALIVFPVTFITNRVIDSYIPVFLLISCPINSFSCLLHNIVCRYILIISVFRLRI